MDRKKKQELLEEVEGKLAMLQRRRADLSGELKKVGVRPLFCVYEAETPIEAVDAEDVLDELQKVVGIAVREVERSRENNLFQIYMDPNVKATTVEMATIIDNTLTGMRDEMLTAGGK